MRFIFLISMAAILFSCKSGDKKEKDKDPVAIKPVLIEKIPPGMGLAKGATLREAWQWTDKTGENILILAFIEPYDDKDKNEYDEEGKTAQLQGSLNLMVSGYEGVWTIRDSVKSCPFDITAEWIKDATTITDLDNDGIAETTILYRMACRSDVSPSVMKLIMHEGKEIYSLKGFSWLRASPEDSFTVTEKDANLETLSGYKPDEDYLKTAGRYESEKEFAQAPPAFLDHARKQWMKFVKERME